MLEARGGKTSLEFFPASVYQLGGGVITASTMLRIKFKGLSGS